MVFNLETRGLENKGAKEESEVDSCCHIALKGPFGFC